MSPLPGHARVAEALAEAILLRPKGSPLATITFHQRKAIGWFISAAAFCVYIAYTLIHGQRISGSTWLLFLLCLAAGVNYLGKYKHLAEEQARERELPLEEGGMYSVERDDHFVVVKVLTVEEGGVHVRVYNRRYSHRPDGAAAEDLVSADSARKDALATVTIDELRSWWPRLIRVETVGHEELEQHPLSSE